VKAGDLVVLASACARRVFRSQREPIVAVAATAATYRFRGWRFSTLRGLVFFGLWGSGRSSVGKGFFGTGGGASCVDIVGFSFARC